MIKNYFKVALRSLWKSKTFSLVKISGLALGIASCLLILLYVNDEWAYDSFHEKGNEIYRVTNFESDDGIERFTANSYYPLASKLDAVLPEKSEIVRYFPHSILIKNPKTNEITQEEQFFFADSLFFELFSFPFAAGKKADALVSTNGLVLTKSTAKRFFGEEDPLGQQLLLEGENAYFVSGVVEDPPDNSSLQFEFIAPMKGIGSFFDNHMLSHRAWYHPSLYTFAYIPDKAFVADWENYQPKWKENYLPERIRDQYTFHLQPLEEMHFLALENDMAASTKTSFLWVLMAIAFLILGIACVNYINLSLTGLMKRFQEIGMRKVLGALNRNILQQMTVEAFLVVGISVVIGIALIQFVLPFFNQVTDKHLELFSDNSELVWTVLTGTALILTFIIALFPFWGLSGFPIIKVLKGKMSSRKLSARTFPLKNGLVVFQFTAAIGLIFATLVIQKQLKFINQKDIGFQPEQIMVVPIRDNEVQYNYQTVKNTLLSQPGIKSVSAISNFPWESGFYDFPTTISGNGFSQKINFPTLLVDEDFLNTMQIRINEGRSFSKEYGTDESMAFIFNEAAIQKIDIEQLTDVKVSMGGVKSGDPKEGRIIGVAKDFHLKSLHNPVDPLILTISSESYFLDNFVIRLETENLPATIATLSKRWTDIVPHRPFEYFFLEDAFEKLYQKESRMGVIFQSFTMLALFIAFLGLLALSALSARQRTKEIGIRKVLGASPGNIIQLLSSQFLKLVLIALLLVSPIAWHFMNQWLENFAYHIEIKWWLFILAGMITVVTAALTVGLQALKAAMTNPIDSLRSDE